MRLTKAMGRPLYGRDVWCPPYLSRRGGLILLAIDSRGRCVAEDEVLPGDDFDAKWAALANYLDRVDPRPVLRLVKPAEGGARTDGDRAGDRRSAVPVGSPSPTTLTAEEMAAYYRQLTALGLA